MLEKFYSNKFDNEIALISQDRTYTFCELKSLIKEYSQFLKSKKNNILITDTDNFQFIIHFFGAIFANKTIYLATNNPSRTCLNIDFDKAEVITLNNPSSNCELQKINPDNIIINLLTSGSSGTAKTIKKTLSNFITEAKTIKEELKLPNTKKTVVSSTNLCHLFGLTFHLMVALTCGYIIDTKTILYPEELENSDTIFISTPTFLNIIKKFGLSFATSPEYIFSAGSKLNEDVFDLLKHDSKVSEIYGSTETGVIAYKTNPIDFFKLFNTVNIELLENSLEVSSNHIYNNRILINDNIELKERYLKINSRTDRVIKIYEKRISIDEMENSLNTNELVNDCYILKHEGKLACLCALSKKGRNTLLKDGITNLTKDLKAYLKQEFEVIPQKWKYIDIIPKTVTGKVDKNYINHLFNLKLSLPIILDRKVEDNSITFKIFFYNQCNFFKGHFPKFKILAGVVQLYLAKEFANREFQLKLGAGQWKKIKFTNIIKPDKTILLKLERTEKHVSYQYFDEEQNYASGVFLCKNVFKESL